MQDLAYNPRHRTLERPMPLTTYESDFVMATPQNTKLIPLTQDKFAIVDADDYEWLNKWSWCVSSKNDPYATGKVNRKITLMHRYIINAPHGMEVDHINNNRLDNRKCNLRLCTRVQNARNCKHREDFTSKYKGVSWHRKARKWTVVIMVDYKQIYLGLYNSELEAAKIYDDAARKYFGSFAKPNGRFYAK